MCLVDLNSASQRCGHRWYHLVRPCAEGVNLETCSNKLALQGWEIKCDFCPFCAGWPLGSDEFRILGGDSRNGSISSAASCSSDGADPNDFAKFRRPNGVPLSRQPSLSASVSSARRLSRVGSYVGASSDSIAATVPHAGGPIFAASEKNLSMNARVNSYCDEFPETMVGGVGHIQRRRSTKGGRPLEESMTIPEESEVGLARSNSSWKRRSRNLADYARRTSRDFSCMR